MSMVPNKQEQRQLGEFWEYCRSGDKNEGSWGEL